MKRRTFIKSLIVIPLSAVPWPIPAAANWPAFYDIHSLPGVNRSLEGHYYILGDIQLDCDKRYYCDGDLYVFGSLDMPCGLNINGCLYVRHMGRWVKIACG